MPATAYATTATIPRPDYLGGGQWQLAALTPLTVLFGKNGSGKSLLLRSWRDSQVRSTHYVVPERTGGLGFNASYLQQQIDAQQRRDQSSGNYIVEYRERVIARIQAYFVARGATRGHQLPGDPAILEQLISTLLPDFAVQLVGANPPYTLKRSDTQGQVGNVEQLSSGEAQVVTLGIDVLTIAAIWDIQNQQSRLLLIDEPDAHIHPDLQARLADFLVQVADQYNLQVVVATHSTTFLSAIGQFGADKCSVIYVDRTRSQFSAQSFTSTLKELAACLGGHALMGPLFGAPLLLVEGDDDYRVWSQVPRHHATSFSVIPCHGQEIYNYQSSLEKVFQALRDGSAAPAGYVLLDGDKPLPTVSSTRPQSHVRFLRLACRETENLFLSDEVLQLLGHDWTSAVGAITTAASQHGAKAAKLSSAASWNRQMDDIKDVINEVSLAIDPKRVHWTQRLGVAIGRSKPTGQLAMFLGADVIAALWS